MERVGEPVYLSRVSDPRNPHIDLGYKELSGTYLLFNSDQEVALLKLPETFSFAEARHAYGREDNATRQFLKKAIGLGLVRQDAKGQYTKVKK